MDDIEHALDNGVNVVIAITRDPRLVHGASTIEMQLVEWIQTFSNVTPDLSLSENSVKHLRLSYEHCLRALDQMLQRF